MQEVPPEHQETLFYSEGDWALVQVAQGGCGVLKIFKSHLDMVLGNQL